jgi:hypothetical protein
MADTVRKEAVEVDHTADTVRLLTKSANPTLVKQKPVVKKVINKEPVVYVR